MHTLDEVRTLDVQTRDQADVGHPSLSLPDSVTQLPLPVLPLPQVGRAERIGQVVEIGPVHQRLPEHFRGLRELLLGDAEVAEGHLYYVFKQDITLSFAIYTNCYLKPHTYLNNSHLT